MKWFHREKKIEEVTTKVICKDWTLPFDHTTQDLSKALGFSDHNEMQQCLWELDNRRKQRGKMSLSQTVEFVRDECQHSELILRATIAELLVNNFRHREGLK